VPEFKWWLAVVVMMMTMMVTCSGHGQVGMAVASLCLRGYLCPCTYVPTI